MASVPLSKTICLIHPERPATARCPGCGTFYCGECITEHDGKLTCAKCLAAEKPSADKKKRGFSLPLMPVVHLAVAIVVCWIFYYSMARILGSIPDDFHDGTIWTDETATLPDSTDGAEE